MSGPIGKVGQPGNRNGSAINNKGTNNPAGRRSVTKALRDAGYDPDSLCAEVIQKTIEGFRCSWCGLAEATTRVIATDACADCAAATPRERVRRALRRWRLSADASASPSQPAEPSARSRTPR